MAPVSFDGGSINQAMVNKSSIKDCQSFCASDPNVLGMGFAGSSCWCYTIDLSIQLYGLASKTDGDAYIQSWTSPKDDFHGFSKATVGTGLE